MKHIEITGKWIGERTRFGDVMIGSIMLDESSLLVATEQSHFLSEMTVKGPIAELDMRQPYRFFGKWAKYQNRRTGCSETQFEFSTCVPARSHDREGVINYLLKHGAGQNFGPATASKVWDEFGANAVKVIRENPLQLRRISNRMTEEQCFAIQASLIDAQGIEDTTIELTNLLSGRKFPRQTATLAIQAWGNRAAEVIYRDPYRLMQFSGIGFKLADRMYIDLGRRPTRIRRQLYFLSNELQSNNEGHVWFPAVGAKRTLEQNFGSMSRFDRAMELGKAYADARDQKSRPIGGLLAENTAGSTGQLDELGSFGWIAAAEDADTESQLAEMIADAMGERLPEGWLTQFGSHEVGEQCVIDRVTCHRCRRTLTAPEVHVLDGVPFGPTCIGHVDSIGAAEIVPLNEWLQSHFETKRYVDELPSGVIELPAFSLWPDVNQIPDISDHQRAKLDLALTGPVAILGGRPGTGKTFTVARLLKTLVDLGKLRFDEIVVGAPTGKAAVRLTEVMEAAGLPIRARTWHSLILQAKRLGGQFEGRLLVGDEMSMCDQSLLLQIFQARPKYCHVLLVGDVNQLPPVGRGAPMRDMIAAGLPFGELTEIKRNSGGIVETCAAIVDGRSWGPGDNLKFVESKSSEISLEWLETVIGKMSDDMDRVWDCQVLIAVNAKSELSKDEVNKFLQSRLNDNQASSHPLFRVGDKVVCTKNGSYSILETGRSTGEEAFVANGELAKVLSIDASFLVVELQNPNRIVKVPFGKRQEGEEAGNGCDWDLGYAISCHRSQGSEWPWVVVMIDDYPGAKMVCSREWMNTAISRAKEKCVLIGKKTVADQFCRRKAIDLRKTFLRERIGQRLLSRVLEEI